MKYPEINLDNCSKELQLVFELLSEQNSVSEIIEKYQLKVNWQEFIKLICFHKVYPAIYLRLSLEDFIFIPREVKEQLHHLYLKNSFSMLSLAREMDDINSELQRNHIRMIMLKGPSLCYQLYGDLTSRTSNDLDILISFQDLEKTMGILEAKGYQLEYEPPRKLKDWQVRNHHMEYIHIEKNCKVEIHWRMHPGPNKEPSFEELWKSRKTLQITETPINILDEETQFFYLITHGARHGWFRIRWLLDIVQLLRNNPELVGNSRKEKEFQASHLFQQSVHLLERTNLYAYSGEINKRSKKLAQKAFTFMKERVNFYYPPNKEWDKEGQRYLFEMKPWSQKLHYLVRKFAANSWDAEVFPLPRALHFLYIPLRPFLWGWRAVIKRKITFRRL